MSLQSLTSVHSVDVYREAETRGAAGSAAYTYTKIKTLRCRVQPLSSAERQLALQRGSELTHKLFSTTDPGVEEGDELRFGSRKFDVPSRATNTDELDRLWVLMVNELDQGQ